MLVAAGATIDSTNAVSTCVSSDTDIVVLLNKAVLMKHNNDYFKEINSYIADYIIMIIILPNFNLPTKLIVFFHIFIVVLICDCDIKNIHSTVRQQFSQ